ncbi:DNA/RNA non-specific endonuclease [Micromonospora sp. NPDC049102]|uniref:DNA/RNA non-specific endonuclease n=1 Tax=Micromonospora sp. NPDC049102 TaxID=3364265 RepID=UPI00371B6882
MSGRRQALLCGVSVALLALTGCTGGGKKAEVGTKDAFTAAIEAMRQAPALQYTSDLGGVAVTTRATSAGQSLSTMALGSIDVQSLSIGGKAYVRFPDGFAVPGTTGAQSSSLTGKWLTGGAAAGPAAQQPLTPRTLADAVDERLRAEGTTFPRSAETTPVEGVTTWKATTPQAEIFVSTQRPYRLVQIMSKEGGASLPSLPSLPALPTRGADPSAPALPSLPSPPSLPTLPGMPTLRGAAHTSIVGAESGGSRQVSWRRMAPAAPTLPGRIRVADMGQAEVDALFRDLTGKAKELESSFDLSYQFTAKGNARFTGCGPGACRITVTISSRFVGKDLQTPKSASATMTVTMTGDGRPVGGCATTGTLPVNATGQLSCTNVSPTWTSWYLRARAQRGAHVYAAQAQVLARAVTRVQVQRILDELQEWLDDARTRLQPTPTAAPSASASPAPATVSPSPSRSTCVSSRPPGAQGSGGGWIVNTTQPVANRNKTTTPPGGPGARASQATACITRPAAKGTAAQGDITGWQDAQSFAARNGGGSLARCHLVANVLGGKGIAANLVPCWQVGMNTGTPSMRTYEQTAQTAVGRLNAGEAVYYEVTAQYRDATSTIPTSVTMSATVQKADGTTQPLFSGSMVPNNRTVNGAVVNLGN